MITQTGYRVLGKQVKQPSSLDGDCLSRREVSITTTSLVGWASIRNKKMITKEMKEELEHYKRTRVPRCTKCKKNMVKVNEHQWKYNCKCNKKDIRLMVG